MRGPARRRRVVMWPVIDGKPFMTMECGHTKAVPRGVYGGQNEVRLCYECGEGKEPVCCGEHGTCMASCVERRDGER